MEWGRIALRHCIGHISGQIACGHMVLLDVLLGFLAGLLLLKLRN